MLVRFLNFTLKEGGVREVVQNQAVHARHSEWGGICLGRHHLRLFDNNAIPGLLHTVLLRQSAVNFFISVGVWTASATLATFDDTFARPERTVVATSDTVI